MLLNGHEAFHGNEQSWFRGNYKDGKEEGLWEYFYASGKLDTKGNFKDGKRDGVWEQKLQNERETTKTGKRNLVVQSKRHYEKTLSTL